MCHVLRPARHVLTFKFSCSLIFVNDPASQPTADSHSAGKTTVQAKREPYPRNGANTLYNAFWSHLKRLNYRKKQGMLPVFVDRDLCRVRHVLTQCSGEIHEAHGTKPHAHTDGIICHDRCCLSAAALPKFLLDGSSSHPFSFSCPREKYPLTYFRGISREISYRDLLEKKKHPLPTQQKLFPRVRARGPPRRFGNLSSNLL